MARQGLRLPHRAMDQVGLVKGMARGRARITTTDEALNSVSSSSLGPPADFRLLYLFAGEPRKGDLRSALQDLARATSVTLQVEEFDLVRGHDLLADEIWLPLLRRVKNREFTHLFSLQEL